MDIQLNELSKKEFDPDLISKRIDLNDLEAKILKMKADQCHLSEADYLRELIMNSQPVEAPPRQFYEQMEKVNRIASTIQRICATAQDKDGIAELKSIFGYFLMGTANVSVWIVVSVKNTHWTALHNRLKSMGS